MSEAVAPKADRFYTIIPIILVTIVMLLVMPIPPLILDFLLATSLSLSVALLLISINLERPLDLSAFPTILLFATLLRLALNVASTRLILLQGNEGTRAAGGIIEAFGNLVIGGNYVVGAAIFILLVIINFIVITKGAGRVAEVAARFTLDGLPGRQMSIDADLASGALTQEQATKRRKELEQESDFFGAMDGASKFVRGDAIAGLLMTGINVVMGFIVGVAQHYMEVADAAATYTVLSVGDGLSAQIPALLISTAAGVVVTRASAGTALSPVLVAQLSQRKTALYSTAGFMLLVSVLPGVPMLPFVVLGGAIIMMARGSKDAKDAVKPIVDTKTAAVEMTEREKLEAALPLELLELEVGFDLVPLVDSVRGGELVERITAIRKNLATELGVLIPSIHIRDNLQLRSGAYRLRLSRSEEHTSELQSQR